MPDTIISKVCTKCKTKKSVDMFWRNKSAKDGFQSWCKICLNPAIQAYQQTSRGKLSRQKARANHRKTQKCKDTTKAYVSRDYVKKMRYDCKMQNYHAHPEKRRASNRIRYLIRIGRMKHANKYTCTYCDEQARMYHHPEGYMGEDALKVIPICHLCHYHVHAQVPSPATKW